MEVFCIILNSFTEILFDEPTINPALLTTRERDVYQNGRNPRFWAIPDDLTGKEYDRQQKSLKRAETSFRALLNQHRQGNDWQSQTATLIGQTWERLATVNDDLLTRISECRAAWRNSVKTAWPEGNNRDKTVMGTPEMCPLLTGVLEPNAGRETVEKCPLLTGSNGTMRKGQMSVINPLSVVLISDNDPTQQTDLNAGRETVPAAPDNSSKTVGKQGRITRPTASQLRANPDLLAEVEQGRKQYAKGSKENRFKRAAHHLRNDDSNERNNLARRLRRLTDTSDGQTLPVFAPAEVIRLTPDQRAALDHWQGTRYEIRL